MIRKALNTGISNVIKLFVRLRTRRLIIRSNKKTTIIVCAKQEKEKWKKERKKNINKFRRHR